MYVPCFLINTDTDYPTFQYSMSDATTDPQLCASLNPDYILTLIGEFDAETCKNEL
jgi:hypothetical protein